MQQYYLFCGYEMPNSMLFLTSTLNDMSGISLLFVGAWRVGITLVGIK